MSNVPSTDFIKATRELAGRIVEAVATDEQGEGCDISAGLLGTALSDEVRTLALQQLDCKKYETLLREFDAYSAHDKDYAGSPFQQRVRDALST